MRDRYRHSDEYDPEPPDRPSADEVSLDPVTRADNFRAGMTPDELRRESEAWAKDAFKDLRKG